jgi:hypothetical protein
VETTNLLRIYLIISLLIFPNHAVSGEESDQARSVIDRMSSDAFKKKLSDSLKRAGQHLEKTKKKTVSGVKKSIKNVKPIVADSKKNAGKTLQNLSKPSNKKEDLLIFLSESMPDYKIWRFLNNGLKLMPFKNVRFVMNGFPQKKIIEEYTQRHKTNIRLSIDPFLFEKYDIKAVPAVIIGEYRVDAPLNLSEVLTLIEEHSGNDYSKMKYELQIP